MVCFELLLTYPIPTRELVARIAEVRMDHLFKHSSATCLERLSTTTHRLYRVSVCDEDASMLLRYSPEGTGCLWVRFLHAKTLLYSNSKATELWIRPPRDPLLKKVYWAASKLEKATPSKSSRN